MKKFILIILILFYFCSCTEQQRAREFGGTMEVKLPPGEELMEVTWKDNELFYLTRPMSDDYIPVKKTFKEKSSVGLIEGTVYFIECR